MTLILALGSPDYTIQLSDRQVTALGGPVTPTENKASLLTCHNARLLVGFTGLARVGNFRTAEWLLEALLEAAPPDDLAEGIVKRFTDIANKRFATPSIKRLSPAARRLTVMVTGYGYWTNPPLLVSALISNFQDFMGGVDRATAWDEFRHVFISEKRPPVDEPIPTYLQRVGAWATLSPQDLEPLRDMLRKRLPPAALIGKAVAIMRTAADKPQAAGTVGKELTSAVLRPDPAAGPEIAYHPLAPTQVLPMLNQAFLLGDGNRILMRDAVLEAVDPAPPIAVQKARRNEPCPCGSGKKYKRCHGA